MVTVKFICVIAGAHIIKFWSCIILSFLNGLQSFATACQAEMPEGPRQAELGSGCQRAGKSSHAMLHGPGGPGTQRAAATRREQGEGSFTRQQRDFYGTLISTVENHILTLWWKIPCLVIA